MRKKVDKNFTTVTRAYKLKITSNRDKSETSKYFLNRFRLYVNQFLGNCYFYGDYVESTSGLSHLANQAQHKAQGMAKAMRKLDESKLKAGIKVKNNVPLQAKIGVPVNIEKSENTTFDYVVKVPNFLAKNKTIYLMAKSHKKLNQSLKNGWNLTYTGELNTYKDELFVHVFVTKVVPKAEPIADCIGVDVGIRHCVASSEGYLGTEVKSVLARHKTKEKARRQNKHKVKSGKKTELKQILNREAKVLIARCRSESKSLAVESRVVLNNLKTGKLQGWARNYFANRVEILAKENSVFMVEVNPHNTSQMCGQCDGKGVRIGKNFYCPFCKKNFNSDSNTGINISKKGWQVILEKILPKWRSGCRQKLSRDAKRFG